MSHITLSNICLLLTFFFFGNLLANVEDVQTTQNVRKPDIGISKLRKYASYLQVMSTDLKLPPTKQQCPLCRQKHVNATTTSISGFVYCYSCLYNYIQKFGCCPVTYRPCSVEDMIRLHHSWFVDRQRSWSVTLGNTPFPSCIIMTSLKILN